MASVINAVLVQNLLSHSVACLEKTVLLGGFSKKLQFSVISLTENNE